MEVNTPSTMPMPPLMVVDSSNPTFPTTTREQYRPIDMSPPPTKIVRTVSAFSREISRMLLSSRNGATTNVIAQMRTKENV